MVDPFFEPKFACSSIFTFVYKRPEVDGSLSLMLLIFSIKKNASSDALIKNDTASLRTI